MPSLIYNLQFQSSNIKFHKYTHLYINAGLFQSRTAVIQQLMAVTEKYLALWQC